MSKVEKNQSFQDWFTQKWVVLSGRTINLIEENWLKGPIGKIGSVSEDFISEFESEENLRIENKSDYGLIDSISQLALPESLVSKLDKSIIDFYENTSNYNLQFSLKWNPLFKPFGYLVNRLFSKRISQLNIPSRNLNNFTPITSQIIALADKESNSIKYKFWLRKIKDTNEVVFSGVYSLCTLPSNKNCIKAVFPLPNGNATVILEPNVKKGELILNSSGKMFGDSGFYFLLKDNSGIIWAKYIKSFQDTLRVFKENNQLKATQNLTLWNINVLTIEYLMDKKSEELPVNKSIWYLTHIQTTAYEFDFLVTDLKFKKIKDEFVGREHWTVYKKKPIKIEIWSDFGELPYVLIRNTELLYDESKHLDNRDNIDDFNSTAKQIRQNWNKRREPIQKRFMDNWLNKGDLDLSELDNDYENQGKQEHKEYLRQAAMTVRENIELKKGKIN